MIAVLLQFAAVCGYALANSGVRFLVLLTVTWRHTMNVPRRTLTVTLWQYTSQEYPAIPVAKVSETSYERSPRHFQVTLLLWSKYSSSLLQCLAYPQQAWVLSCKKGRKNKNWVRMHCITYNVNRTGPRMDPCGTPTVRGSGRDKLSSIRTT